ncbi:MAG TPA: hypothetical protein VGE34_04640 [Candidatus Saccharimonadales bacterium]
MVTPESVNPGDGNYGEVADDIDDQVFGPLKEPRVTIPEAPETPKGHPDLLATSVLGMIALITVGTGVGAAARRYKRRKAGE